ncbi:tyrosine-type recombinase/integrase [Enterococcus faecalis]|uniref:tyrosine-type recombinase/integrase n=1 Tax=Enterococcus sp. AZ029 TaxID=2774841 RepID=UPI003F251138
MYEKSRKKWSAEDLDYLRKNYDKVPTEQLAKNLQRKIGGIHHKAGELDLTKQSWKESDRQFLLDNYGKIKTREIAEKLGKTMRAVHKKASFMGLKVSEIKQGKTVQKKKQTSGVCHKSKWTRDEDEFLFQNIDKLTYEKLSQKLNREISDVKSRTKKFKLKRTTAYLKKYHNFIVENGEKKTAKEIADELEVPARLVKQYCRENDVYILVSKGKMKASVRAKNLGIEKKITKINSSMTFKDWCVYWMNTYKIGTSSNVTLEKYYICFCRWCESEMADVPLGKLTRGHVQKYLNQYGMTHSKQTVLDHRASLKQCLNDALIDGIITTNPVTKLNLVYKEQKLSVFQQKEMREQKKWLEIDEYLKLKEFLANDLEKSLESKPIFENKASYPQQLIRMLIFVGLKTGARFAELLGLTGADVDVINNILNIEKTWDYKGNHGFSPTKNFASIRKVLVDDETIELLKLYNKWLQVNNINVESNTLFNIEGKQLHNSMPNNELTKVLSQLDIERISFHKLRHTQASYLLAKEVPIDLVAKRLGHTDTNMINKVYGHLLKETEEKGNKMILNLI